MKPTIICVCLFFLYSAALFARDAPPVYILPAIDKAVIVLGDAPESTRSFQVFRKSRGQLRYDLVTPESVTAAADPFEAVRLMGSDFQWIARKLDSVDPTVLWRKLRLDRNLAQAYSLVSHGLRLALGRTWVDRDVIPGQRYDYRVLLLDSAGNEIGRYEKRIRIEDPEQPPPPGNVVSSYEDGLVSIDWEYPPFQGGEKDRTVGFIILRKRGDGPFEPLGPAPVLRIENYLNAFDDKVRFGETYTYAVVAQDVIGVISSRSEAPPLVIEDVTPPLVPTGLKATDRGDDVLLIWKMSPELDVSHYDVYRAFTVEDNGDNEKINRSPIPFDMPRFEDKNAPRGMPLYYRVAAVDSRGNESPLSGPATLLAEDKEPPGPVERLRAEIDEELRTVELSWRGPDDRDLAGYHVYSGSREDRLMRITAAPLEPAGNPSFTDSGYEERGLEPGRSLVYGVAAVDNSFNEGPREILEVEIPDNVPPDTPSGFAVRPTREGAVRLTWQPLLCFDLASYRVYRRDAGKFELVAELDKARVDWLDEEVERGTPYQYYLTALDTSGNESPASAVKEIIPTDIRAPAAPGELQAKEVAAGVRLSWAESSESDVSVYRVYRSDYPGGEPRRLISEVINRNGLLDREGSSGLVYGVSAVDTSGNEGERSEAIAE